MDWSTKKFNYKIVDDKGKTIAFVYKKLEELEEFINESNLHLRKMKRTGPNDFLVEISKEPGWKI